MEGNYSKEVNYNLAVDFINSILKFCNMQIREVHWNTPDIQKDIAKDLLNLTPNEKVKEWLQYVNDNISPILKNSLLFVTDDNFELLNVCLYLIEMENISTPLELFDAFKNLDTDTMVEISFKFYEVDAPLTDDILLEKAIAESFNEKTAGTFMHYKNNPKEYQKDFLKTITLFYNEFFKLIEKDLLSFMSDRLKTINELYKKDPMYFINTLGIGDYSKAVNLHNSVVIYISYFLDIGFMFFSYKDSLILTCGQNVELVFENKEKLNRYKELFKALSDDKRLAILKLTSKRPWYNKELADYFNLTPATLSYHLNLLLNLGVLNFEPSIINNRYYYTTNKEMLKKLFDIALDDLLN